MARGQQGDDLLIDGLDGDLAKALFSTDDPADNSSNGNQTVASNSRDGEYDSVPGQLAVDVYETPEQLIVKARTAGVNKNDLDVSIADGVLTISGTLSSGDDSDATHWHVQEWRVQPNTGPACGSQRGRGQGCAERWRAYHRL